jgi:hypothetical protein
MKELRNDSPFVFGNTKLPETTAILNICPASLCPSKLLGYCQLKDPNKTCYALSEERRFKSTCIPSRLRMTEYWDRGTAWSISQDLLALNSSKRRKLIALRINECGDFRHQMDLEKAEDIGHYLKQKGNIVTYCYTARLDLDFEVCDHLVVNGSGWNADNRFQVAYDLKKNEDTPGWTCKDKHGVDVHVDRLCPGDCRKCDMCQKRGGLTIGVIPH